MCHFSKYFSHYGKRTELDYAPCLHSDMNCLHKYFPMTHPFSPQHTQTVYKTISMPLIHYFSSHLHHYFVAVFFLVSDFTSHTSRVDQCGYKFSVTDLVHIFIYLILHLFLSMDG